MVAIMSELNVVVSKGDMVAIEKAASLPLGSYFSGSYRQLQTYLKDMGKISLLEWIHISFLVLPGSSAIEYNFNKHLLAFEPSGLSVFCFLFF